MIILKNCNLWTMALKNDIKADVFIEGKKIKKIGIATKEELKNAEVIDVNGAFVMPGIVDPHCHIGIAQDFVGQAGIDDNEITNPITPELRGFDGIKACDESFLGAIRGGVTTVCTGPGSGNVICGTFTAIKTYGKTVSDMLIKEEIAMKMALGENPKRCYGGQNKAPMTRMATAALLREALEKAKRYKASWDEYNLLKKSNPSLKAPEYNQKWESLKRVFEGLPCKIHAHQAEDILTAIRIAKEYNLNITIEHATSALTIPEEVLASGFAVILGPTLGEKSKYEVKDKSFDSAKVMYEYGIPFAFMTDHPVTSIEYTKTQAALYVAHGLPYLEALKALTIYAAKIVGLDNIVGSIEEGKDADIVCYSGDPLAYTTRTKLVICNGKVCYKED